MEKELLVDLKKRTWQVWDLGGGQIVAKSLMGSWPARWLGLPEIPTWTGKASSGVEAIERAALWCFLHELPWSGRRP